MNCKFCQAQLEEENPVCPACGRSQEEPELTGECREPDDSAEALQQAQDTREASAAEQEEGQESEQAAEPEDIADTQDEDAQEEQPQKTRKPWMKAAAIICCVILLAGLALGVWYGVNGSLLPRENDVYFKDSYTASERWAELAADRVVATAGGKELTNGQLQIFYWMSVYDFLEEFGGYLDYFGLDFSKPLSEQYVSEDGMSWEQYFLDVALSNWHNYQCLVLMAEQAQFSMSDELRAQIDSVAASMEDNAVFYGFDSAEEMIRADMGPTASLETYMDYMEIYFGGLEYFESLYNQVEVTQEEIDAYYGEHSALLQTNYGVNKESGRLVDVRHILVCPKGGSQNEYGETVYSQEEWDTCLVEAESLLKRWQEGEATEESFALLANEATEDPGSAGSGGLYTFVYEGQMVPAFNDWCFDESRKPGDTGLVKTNYGYHIIYFVYGDEGWIRRSEQELIADQCSQLLDQVMLEYPMEVNFRKIVLSNVELSQ